MFEEIFKNCEKVTFVLGSVQESRTLKNPFTKEERLLMLHNVMKSEITSGILNIVPLPDINNLPKWSDYILKNIPDIIDIFYAGSEFDALPFISYPVKNYPKFEINILDRFSNKVTCFRAGTQVRELIYKRNSSWKNYVPAENWSLINKIISNDEFQNKLGMGFDV